MIRVHEKLVLLALALLMAIAGLYANKTISILLPVLTLLLIWYEGGIKKVSVRLSPPFVFLFLLLIWIGMSTLWAENPIAAFKTFISLTLTFAFSLIFLSYLMRATPELISKAYTIVKFSGLLLILLIINQLVIDTYFPYLLKYNGQDPYMLRMKPTGSILGLTAFVGCAFLSIKTNKTLSIVTFLIIFLLIVKTHCQTAMGGMILASFVFVLSYLMPFWVTRISMIGSYTFLILSPFFYTHILTSAMIGKATYLQWVVNSSFLHRYIGWEYYSKKFFEKPFLGWGVNSSRYIPTDKELAPGFQHLLHPHNNSIQAYAELGLIGGILYACFFASLFYLVEKHVKDRLSIAVCNATIAFGFIGAEITHNAWSNFWLSLVTLTTGLIILFIKVREAQLPEQGGHLVLHPAQ